MSQSEPRSDGGDGTVRKEADPPGALARVIGVSPEAALQNLRSTRAGLSADEAAARLKTIGPNQLPRAHGPGLVRQLLDQLVHFFALMLWAAAGLAVVGGMPQLAAAIAVVVVVNGVFSFAQEYRAERAVHALSALLPETAVVRRAGHKLTVPAAELVPGDVVLLREGDRISADARVIRSSGLKVDMSTLTGESKSVERSAAPLPAIRGDPLDSSNVVFAGTFVTSGSGLAVVAATAGATRLGGISRLTGQVVRRPTPLRVQLDRAVYLIAGLAVLTGVVFFGVATALGMPAHDGFLFSVGVIVALVPEGLLPTLSLSLAMSATRMARRGALVRRLESVETLGSTTVICTDKTGTLTTNQMTARSIVLPGVAGPYAATGIGYDPSGTLVTTQGRPLGPEAGPKSAASSTPPRCVATRASRGRWSLAVRRRSDRGSAAGPGQKGWRRATRCPTDRTARPGVPVRVGSAADEHRPHPAERCV